jgi:hypothetical protein
LIDYAAGGDDFVAARDDADNLCDNLTNDDECDDYCDSCCWATRSFADH